MSYFINLSILRRNRNFGLLYVGQVVSFLGTMMTGVAAPYQIYIETRSTFLVGLLSFAQLVPLLFTALIGGVFADRYHRRYLLIISEIVLAAGSLLLAINAVPGHSHIWALFLIAALMSAFNGLHRPAYDSLTQQIVAKEDYPAVGSLSTFRFSIGMILGPAIGGILLAKYGLVVTYIADFFTFIVSLTTISLMTSIPKPLKTQDESTLASLKKALSFALSRQELLGSYLVDFLAMIFGMPIALFPAIALSYGGPQSLGMLYSSLAVGALFVSCFSGWTHKIKRYGAAIAISASLWGITIICFGLATNFYAILFFLALAGGLDAISAIFRQILWNETIPNELRGRMAGIEMISYLSGPQLGNTEAGLVAALFGVTASITSGGVLCLISVGLCCYYLPKFWRYHAEPQTNP